MSPTSSVDLSIINDTQFRQERERSHASDPQTGLPMAPPRTRYSDAFDALERGLELDANLIEMAPSYEPAPDEEGYDSGEPVLARSQQVVPFKAVALVLAACMTLGGATATLILHDEVMQITARWLAGR